MPEDITIEILKQKHPSRPANRNIAELFFKAGYIEVWGRGIAKILNSCKHAGLPEPIMEEFAGGIQITFLKRGNVTDNVTENRRINICNRIKENNRISVDQLAEILKVTRRTIIRDLEILKKQNFIKRAGPAKGGHWEVTEMKK